MKKVGLLTWTTYENYGTFLQWYALSKEIEALGYDCTAISYIPKASYKEPLTYLLKKDFKTFCKVFNDKLKIVFKKQEIHCDNRNKAFESFKNKYFKLTDTCITASDLFSLNDDFDAFVCGSDQIWSPISFNGHFYLDFVDDRNKKVAYAPSMGVYDIENLDKENQIKQWLDDFEYISIREKAGRDIIKKLTGENVPVVLDPTLLINEKEWGKLANKEYETPNNYLLCYFLGQNENYWKKIEKFADKNKLQIVIIPVFKCDFKRKGVIKDDVGPEEFLTLIKNATFVCTDSFHGSVLSMVFEKQFVIFKRFKNNEIKNQNSRIENLISMFGLSDILFSKKNKIDTVYRQKIDYKGIKSILEKEREKSRTYLKESLEKSISSSKSSVFKTTNTCCGCGACSVVCPKQAISIKMNEQGFFEAKIDNAKCIKCKKCRDVCSFYKVEPVKLSAASKVYAAKSKNTEVLKLSSSGGIGFELMNYYKDNKESVGGCLYNIEKKIAESRIIDYSNETTVNLELFQGSKYLQSNSEFLYENILKQGNGIITGTPCQIASLHKLLVLNNKRNDFLLVEIICHGVPSYNLWDKYLKTYSSDKNKITKVIFRNKDFGWHKKVITLFGSKKKYNRDDGKDLFYNFFNVGNCLNDSCYECNYRFASYADLRIGDFWGAKFKNDKTGVSICVCLSEKGKQILNKLEKNNKLFIQEESIQDYVNHQQIKNYAIPVKLDLIRKELSSDLSLSVLSNNYCKDVLLDRKLRKILKGVIKR